jgi:hypothetical protein
MKDQHAYLLKTKKKLSELQFNHVSLDRIDALESKLSESNLDLLITGKVTQVL